MVFPNLLAKLFRSLKRLLFKQTKSIRIAKELNYDSSNVITEEKIQSKAERSKTKFKKLIEEYNRLEGLTENKESVLEVNILDNDSSQEKLEDDSLVILQIENNTIISESVFSNNDHDDQNTNTKSIDKEILLEGEIDSGLFSQDKNQESEEVNDKDLNPTADLVTSQEVNDKLDNFQEIMNKNLDSIVKLVPSSSSTLENNSKPDQLDKKDQYHDNSHLQIDIEENVSVDIRSIQSDDEIPTDPFEKQTKLIQKESHAPFPTINKKVEKRSNKRDLHLKKNFSINNQLFKSNIVITDKELLTFKQNLSDGLLINFSLEKLNAFIMKFFEELEFIGELPVNQEACNQICQLIQKEGLTKFGNPKPRVIPPAVFVSSMVLCAQFSKEEARNFWLPYAKMVWNTDEASQNFQRKCRDHFIYCRSFLRERFDFDFPVIRNGDVVRPIYYQAIIPHYLQLDFANWLVDNQIWISNSSMEDLLEKLHNGFNMDNIPSQLSNFMQAKDTENTVVNLIMRMVAALSLYHETNNETVEAVLNSQIQKSIWKNIINVMLGKKSQSNRYLSRRIRLTWLWDTSDNELYLKVFNVIASQQRLPGAIVWDSSTAIELLYSEVLEQIYLPPNISEEGYLIDPIKLSDGPIDGNIYILSKDYDEVNYSFEERKKFILYNEPIPKIIQNKILYFRIKQNSSEAILHDRIEANGKWIIVHSGDIEILDKNKNSLAHTPLPLPNQLQTQRQSFTAGIYDIELPITISQNNEILENFSNTKDLFLEPQLSGTMIKNFSKDMPPVFSKNDISMSFQKFSDLKVNRTWILINKFDHLIESRKFSELQKVGLLHFENENVEIKLNLFNISEPGIYSVLIVQDMRQLIENPLKFYFLPLNFTHPNPEKLYSPNDYPSVKIENIHKGQVIIRESKAKVIENDQEVHVEWRNLVDPVCKLYLRFDKADIPLYWDINRVFAWVEGLGDDQILRQNDTENAQLHIRGSKNCNYSLQIGNDIRSEQLNAKGNFDELIRRTPIVDMIKQQEKSKGEINIDIRNKKWLIAHYLKHPTVRLKQNYFNSNEKKLSVNFEINKFYEGDYKVQIQNYEDSNSAPITIYEGKYLKQSIEFFQEIQNGSYEILVFNYDEKIELIDNVSLNIENQVYNPSFSEFDLTLVENSKDYSVNIIKNPNLLFKRFCTNGNKLKSESKNLEKVWAPLDQIKIINDFNKWQHFPENQHFQGPRLLPSWAVIDHPLTFMTTDHSRKLYVFPEKVAYKGKAGKGYMALKINGIKTNTYVNWNLIAETSDLLRCRIMIPQSDNYKCISELDEADLWPAYQCQYCGEIIGSREGGFPKFNVEVWVKHRHGRTINKDKLFKDIVFEKGHHLYVRQSSYNQERLQHFHKPSEIYNEYFYKNIQNNHELLKSKELSRPLNLFSDVDYCKAAAELFHNFEIFGSKQKFLSWLNNRQKVTLFEKFENFINQKKKIIPAFSASLRLITNVSFNNHLLNNVDRKVILLSLILRLKANNQFLYNEFIEKFNINESDLIYETHNSASYCPKLLEWAITWAELFYIHAIS